MKGIVAYSRPRGIYGRYYVFTVVLDFTPPNETIVINVNRTRYESGQYKQVTYSCHSCGHFGTVTITVPVSEYVTRNIQPKEHSVKGHLQFYRYDNVEPGDNIQITFQDNELVFSQITSVTVSQQGVGLNSRCQVSVPNPYVQNIPSPPYEVFLIDWNMRLEEQRQQGRPITVEEDLITKVMNNQKITITDLLLEPLEQPLAIDSPKQFIEGTLRYQSND